MPMFVFSLFIFQISGGASYNDVFMMVRMPLFFFVSGFLLDKPGIIWRLKDAVPFIKKKAKIQLIPTFVFMSLFCYLFDLNVIDSFNDSMKSGYWFTITLFEYFLVYSFSKMMPVRFQYKMLFIVSFFFLGIGYLPVWEALQFNKLWYFVFFSFGAYVKSHFSSFAKFLESKYFSIMFVSFCGIVFMRVKGSLPNYVPLQILLSVFLGIAGICIVFNFFRKNETSFRQTTIIGRTLQYIGKRTLDVYLLHYFFLPRHLDVVGDFFLNNSNPSVDFFCSFLLAIMVVALSLVASNVIRTSETLAHWLFGVKRM